MTWGVISVKPEAPITHAAQLMLENGIGEVAVIDGDGQLVGIVTEGDLLRHLDQGRRPHWLELLCQNGRPGAEAVRACNQKVSDIMTPRPVTVSGGASLPDIVRLLEKHRIKRLPVMDDGRLVGMVTRPDFLRALVKFGYEARGTQSHQRKVPEYDKRSWGRASDIEVASSSICSE
jgi:CBS domain-containing protein